MNASPIHTNPEQRRRRHLAVYHRALKSARTPQQRAAVAARYRKLFASGANTSDSEQVEAREVVAPIQLPLDHGHLVRLAS